MNTGFRSALNLFRRVLTKRSSQFSSKAVSIVDPEKQYVRTVGLLAESEIFTHMTLGERVAIHQTLSALTKDVTCVEIGSYLGASTCFICSAISQSSRLICIDTWQNDAMKYQDADTDAEKRDTHAEFVHNTRRFRDKIVEIRRWSHAALDDVVAVAQGVDFLFIDGDHNYDGVKLDWDLYSPLLSPGAIVAFHDTGWAEGVRQVVREDVLPIAKLVRKLPNLEFYCVGRNL